MLGRIEFKADQFVGLVPLKRKPLSKNKYKKVYQWLSEQFEQLGIKHKVIDLDLDRQGNKTKSQYGQTLLIVMRARYQLVCGFFPHQDAMCYSDGVWGLEIYKSRRAIERFLGWRKLNEKDPLVKVLMNMLAPLGVTDLRFLPEKKLPNMKS